MSGAEMALLATQAAVAGVEAARRANHWAKRSLIAASAFSGVGVAAVTAVSAFVGYKVVKPARRMLTEEAQAVKELAVSLPAPQKVSFKSADSRLNLCGYFYPSPGSRSAIILCHGFHGGAVDTHKPACFAQANGYNALTLDFRGCGESDGKTTSVGVWEVEDLLGALEYLRSRPEIDPARIAVYGYSMGGAVAIMAAQRDPGIRALVTDCAFASLDTLLAVNFSFFYRLPHFPFRHTAVWWSRQFSNTSGRRVDPIDALQKMGEEGRQLPHLIIHGQKDPCIPVDNAHLLYEQSPGPKQLWVVPEAEHVVGAFYNPHDYMARICLFLDPLLK